MRRSGPERVAGGRGHLAVEHAQQRPFLDDLVARQDAQGVTLYIPNCLPDPDSLTIDTQNFLCFRSLVIEGWKTI